MQFLKIILTSIGSILALFFSTKVIGNKQMSELSMFYYINGITIGSIAAEMATSLDGDFYYPLLAIAVYTIIMWLISYLSEKSTACRRFFAGRSIVLMQNGKIYNKNFKTVKIDINDFLVQCRINGYFNLDDIDTAIIEQNGKFSFIPKTSAKPLTMKDLQLQSQQEKLLYSIIVDGKILQENLKRSGNNTEWLKNELKKQKIDNIEEIFLAECDNNNTLYIYQKTKKAPKNDPFQ